MIPNESNIVDYHGPGALDHRRAKKHFLGKSLDDAFEMFCKRNNYIYGEDFMYLSDLAVRYYLSAVIKYAESEKSKGDFPFIDWMAGALLFRLRQGTISPDTARIAKCYALAVLERPEKYDIVYEDGEEETMTLNTLRYICENA